MSGHEGSSGTDWRATIASLHRQARYGQWFRWHLVATLAVFCASAFAGYAVADATTIEGLTDAFPGEDALPDLTVWAIFSNNVRAVAILVLGGVTGGLLTVFGLAVNGVVIGGVVGIVGQDTSAVVIVAALAPHGVLELPAVFAAAAIGLRVAHRVGRYLLGYDERPLTRVEAFELAVIGALIVVALAVAAWIEVTVTPEVIEWAGGEELNVE